MYGKKVKLRFLFVFLLLVSVILAVFLLLKSLEENVVYFLSPTEIKNLAEIEDKKIRVGGMVKKESIIIIYAEGCNLGPVNKIAKYVQKKIKNSNVRFSVLGHIQRGGSPSEKDRVYSALFGYHAVLEIINDRSGIMIGVQNDKIVNIDLEKVISNKKKINKELINLSKYINNYWLFY